MLNFKSWLISNLKNLTVERAADFVNKTLIWQLAPGDPCKVMDLLAGYKIDGFVDPSTVWSWMVSCDIKATNDEHKPAFYCDSHEDPETVRYREEYLEKYFELEKRAHLWVQVTKEESDNLLKQKKVGPIKACYACYGHDDNEEERRRTSRFAFINPLRSANPKKNKTRAGGARKSLFG